MKLICKKELHVEIEKDGIRHYDQLVKYFSVCKEKLLNPFTFKRLDFFVPVLVVKKNTYNLSIFAKMNIRKIFSFLPVQLNNF